MNASQSMCRVKENGTYISLISIDNLTDIIKPFLIAEKFGYVPELKIDIEKTPKLKIISSDNILKIEESISKAVARWDEFDIPETYTPLKLD